MLRAAHMFIMGLQQVLLNGKYMTCICMGLENVIPVTMDFGLPFNCPCTSEE